MALKSGMAAQLGTAEETTYGTPVTVDRFFAFRPPETLKGDRPRIESQAIRPGQRVLRSDQWYPGLISAAGDLTLELENIGQGRWWKHALGGVATTQPDAVNSPLVYLHTFTPGDLPVGQTVQLGRPDNTGTVHPWTYHGVRINSWKLEASVGEIATLNFGLLGEDEETDTALAEATFATGIRAMTFVNGTLTVGGSPLEVASASVEANNNLDGNRNFLGSQLRKAPEETDLRAFTGALDPEFSGLTAWNRFKNGTEAELVLTFAGAVIEDALKFQTVITAHVRFDGETPNVQGRGILRQALPWKTVDDGTTSIKVEYQTTDATP